MFKYYVVSCNDMINIIYLFYNIFESSIFFILRRIILYT